MNLHLRLVLVFVGCAIGNPAIADYLVVVGSNGGTRWCNKVDATSGDLIESLAVPTASPTGVDYGDGYLWMVGRNGGTRWLNKVDPSTGNIVQSLATPPASPKGLAYGAGYLWMVGDNAPTTWWLNKVDPSTGNIVQSLVAPPWTPSGLAYGDGYLWMVGDNAPITWWLNKVDPSTGNIVKSLAVPPWTPSGLAYGNGYLWMVGYNGGTSWLKKVDPSTGNIVQSLAAPPASPEGIAYVDTTAPTGSLLIASGVAFVASTIVNLSISAFDPGSGLAQMRFSNDGSNWSNWVAYVTDCSWSLSAGDGLKTVYTQFKDQAGNTSSSVTDTITLDTTVPSGTLDINNGSNVTGSVTVNLSLSATDAGSGVTKMRFSNNGSSWNGWETYGTKKSWSLSSGDGTKTVYVQFKDAVGNVSGSFSNTITLELDTDSDGIPDWWMNQHFGHPTGQVADLSRAGDDKDNDGFNNNQEWIAGTSPTNAIDCFRINSCEKMLGGNGYVFQWDSRTGRLYSAWTTTNVCSVWSYRFQVIGTGGPMAYTNQDVAIVLFLRLQVEKQ